MNKEEEKCCGECCWFYREMTDGEGFCAEAICSVWKDFTRCDSKCWLSRGGNDNLCFVSIKEMRHHMAVLLQANRYRRDDNVPAIYRMPNPTELGKAIDFAVKYMKVFSKL